MLVCIIILFQYNNSIIIWKVAENTRMGLSQRFLVGVKSFIVNKSHTETNLANLQQKRLKKTSTYTFARYCILSDEYLRTATNLK
jgi:hypothetical protein